MGRGVSAGGGQSSLGYLFGGGEAEAPNNSQAAASPIAPNTDPKQSAPSLPSDDGKKTPAGVPGSTTNNYFRADGQNCGNFLTERPSTKVHAAPGGGSQLNYLFGGDGK